MPPNTCPCSEKPCQSSDRVLMRCIRKRWSIGKPALQQRQRTLLEAASLAPQAAGVFKGASCLAEIERAACIQPLQCQGWSA